MEDSQDTRSRLAVVPGCLGDGRCHDCNLNKEDREPCLSYGSGLRVAIEWLASYKSRNTQIGRQGATGIAPTKVDRFVGDIDRGGDPSDCGTWRGRVPFLSQHSWRSMSCSRSFSFLNASQTIAAVLRGCASCFLGWIDRLLSPIYCTRDTERVGRPCFFSLSESHCVALSACTLSRFFPCVSTSNFITGGRCVPVS